MLQGVLTILDPRVDELSGLVRESQAMLSSSTTRPLSVANITYTIMEYACCAKSLPKVYSAALDIQTLASEEICHIELIQELVQEFQSNSVACREILCDFEKVVTELRNGMLIGKMADQPWTSASQVIYIDL